MTSNPIKLTWKPSKDAAVGKGATLQRFFASSGAHELEIDVAPWGEGHLKVNGIEIAHVNDRKDRRQAFNDLKKSAERYLMTQAGSPKGIKNPN